MKNPAVQRLVLAQRLRTLRDDVAERLTDAFVTARPDWATRFGAAGRQRCAEDARFHVDHLAAAVDAGDPDAFARYARWTAGVLGARGIPATHLADHLEQLGRLLTDAIDDGDMPAVATVLAAGIDACRAADASDRHDGAALDDEHHLLLAALLDGNRRAALGIAEDVARRRDDVIAVYGDLIERALHEIGRRWETNRITVADEHLATATAQWVLAHLYARIPVAARPRGRALITGVEAELHQVGAQMVADAIQADGWDVRFLGTSVPRTAILRAVDDYRPDVVGISMTIVAHLPALRALLDGLRSADRPPAVVVGGGAFRWLPSLWQEIAADAFATNCREAARAVAPFAPGRGP